MKKPALLLALALVAADALPAAPRFAGLAKASEVRVRDGIGHVMEKVRAGREVRVAYFGGSITRMDGWRRLSREWLAAEHPRATFTEIHAAIGGTSSTLGAFRCGRDVLAADPDLVLVEFATNDSHLPVETVWRNFDGILRQIWTKDPTTDVVFAYTITASMTNDYARGLCNRSASAMEQLADYYGVPSVGFGPRVMDEVKAGRLVMSLGELATAVPAETPDRDRRLSELLAKRGQILFAKDGVHPALPGHGFYLESFKRAWKAMADLPPVDHAAKLAAPFFTAKYGRARMVPVTRDVLVGSGWQALPPQHPQQAPFGKYCGQMWLSETPGDKLAFRFRGTECRLYGLIGPSGARVRIVVDGVPAPRPVDRFDDYCVYWRLADFPVFDGADGEHEVEVIIDAEQPDRRLLNRRHPQVDVTDAKYDGHRFYLGQIELVGELVGKAAEK